MRKDITVEKLMLGGEKLNKSALAKQYGCCWRTIDRRLNPEKYKREKKLINYQLLTLTYLSVSTITFIKFYTYQQLAAEPCSP